MANLGKILLGAGIVACVGGVIYRLVNQTMEVSAFANQLTTNVMPTSIRFEGKLLKPSSLKLVIKLDVEFVNPTRTSISFQKPNVAIKYGSSLLAQSKVSTDIVTIAASGTSRIKDITFEIPVANLNTLSILIDMIRKTGTGITIDQNATLTQKLTAVFSSMTNNVLTKLLPLMEVSLITYVGDTPITYQAKMG